MKINNAASTNSMSGIQVNTVDSKSKKFQNEITNVQQQLQKLSSKEELSVTEKANERQKLQKEISSLNTELKRHQEELSKSRKREAMMAELREDKESAKEEKPEDKIQTKETATDKAEEKSPTADGQQTGRSETVIAKNNDGTVILKGETNWSDESEEKGIVKETAKTADNGIAADTSLSQKEIHAIVSAGSFVQQAGRQGTIIARTRDGIAVLKGEMRQNERRGIETEKNLAEIEKMEKKEQRATAFQFSILGEAGNAMKSATGDYTAGTKDKAQMNAANNGFNNAFINALNVSQKEGGASQQKFFVSLGHEKY